MSRLNTFLKDIMPVPDNWSCVSDRVTENIKNSSSTYTDSMRTLDEFMDALCSNYKCSHCPWEEPRAQQLTSKLMEVLDGMVNVNPSSPF